MSDAASVATVDPDSRPAKSARRFPAAAGRFDDPRDRATIDELADWVEDYFRADLIERPSKHVYISTLPEKIVAQIDLLRDSPVIHSAILSQFAPGSVMTPMKHTDELYISHYNKDQGGDQGLFDKHYDGNLRFLSFGSVVRALIYLQSDATYKVVFHDSQLAKAFETYEFGLLDFHREFHWVEGQFRPDEQQRILLKCNYLIVPPHATWRGQAVLAANTGVFYVVKAAMEYSKSPRTLPQRCVGLLCNVFRLANNVHPLVPITLLATLFAGAIWGVVELIR